MIYYCWLRKLLLSVLLLRMFARFLYLVCFRRFGAFFFAFLFMGLCYLFWAFSSLVCFTGPSSSYGFAFLYSFFIFFWLYARIPVISIQYFNLFIRYISCNVVYFGWWSHLLFSDSAGKMCLFKACRY